MAESLDAWFKAIATVPPQICGVRLRPYSLSHTMFLAAVRSPLLDAPRAECTHEVLFEALGICSRTHGENVAIYAAGKAPPRAHVKAAHKWISASLLAARNAYADYVAAYTTTPPMLPSEKKRGPCAPWQYHAHLALCNAYGIPFDQAWDMPVGLAMCCTLTWGESQGAKALAFPADVRRAELLKAASAADKAGDAAGAVALRDEYRRLSEMFPPEATPTPRGRAR